MRSFNFKMVLNNVSQLKHIQLTKHMHYCIHKNIPRVLYNTVELYQFEKKLPHNSCVTK